VVVHGIRPSGFSASFRARRGSGPWTHRLPTAQPVNLIKRPSNRRHVRRPVRAALRTAERIATAGASFAFPLHGAAQPICCGVNGPPKSLGRPLFELSLSRQGPRSIGSCGRRTWRGNMDTLIDNRHPACSVVRKPQSLFCAAIDAPCSGRRRIARPTRRRPPAGW